MDMRGRRLFCPVTHRLEVHNVYFGKFIHVLVWLRNPQSKGVAPLATFGLISIMVPTRHSTFHAQHSDTSELADGNRCDTTECPRRNICTGFQPLVHCWTKKSFHKIWQTCACDLQPHVLCSCSMNSLILSSYP